MFDNGLGAPAYLGNGSDYGMPSSVGDTSNPPPPLAPSERPTCMRIVPNADDRARAQANAARPPQQWPPMGNPSYGATVEVGGQFKRWARFGLIDNGVLLVSTIAGFSLDDTIAKKVGVKGYGAMVGALVGNAISDGMAALPEGGQAAAGVTTGALAPLAPVAVAMAMKKPMKGKTAWAVGLSSLFLVLMAFRRPTTTA